MKKFFVLSVAAVALSLAVPGMVLACDEEAHADIPTTTDEARQQAGEGTTFRFFSKSEEPVSISAPVPATPEELSRIVPAAGGEKKTPTTLDEMRGIN